MRSGLPTSLVPRLAFDIMHTLAKLVSEKTPELKPDLPSFTNCDFEIGANDALCIVKIEFKEFGLPSGGEMKPAELERVLELVGEARSYAELKQINALSEFYAKDKFLVIAEIEQGDVNWSQVYSGITAWLADIPIPRALDINQNRVKLALPQPPQFSLTSVADALWVLECEDTLSQGTAFELEERGVITNEHVIAGSSEIVAFRASKPSCRYSVKVLKSNPVLDLATLNIDGPLTENSLRESSTEPNQMDHIAVCGFPNYRLGDSGILSPGVVVGTRNKSGICRYLTNAGIISGMSGGPALGHNNQVMGVCVTGSGQMQAAKNTEDQAIILIRSLDLLNC